MWAEENVIKVCGFIAYRGSGIIEASSFLGRARRAFRGPELTLRSSYYVPIIAHRCRARSCDMPRDLP